MEALRPREARYQAREAAGHLLCELFDARKEWQAGRMETATFVERLRAIRHQGKIIAAHMPLSAAKTLVVLD